MTTDGTENDRKQMKLTSTKYAKLIDIAEDPEDNSDRDSVQSNDDECETMNTLDFLSNENQDNIPDLDETCHIIDDFGIASQQNMSDLIQNFICEPSVDHLLET